MLEVDFENKHLNVWKSLMNEMITNDNLEETEIQKIQHEKHTEKLHKVHEKLIDSHYQN
jgi:phage terminase large subunit-like protein